MSKRIYFVKIWLLSRIFNLSKEEESEVQRVFIFTVVVYAKAWFRAPLSVSAPRNDLELYRIVLKYREVEPAISFQVLKSIRRHQWYLTPQMVTLSLADTSLPAKEREEIARILHSFPRVEIPMGRPPFPEELIWNSKEQVRPKLGSLITSSNSCLIFDLLNSDGPQDWLLTPCSMWSLFSDYRQLEIFAHNLSVTNDLAERGCKMITDFINKVECEEHKQALLQVIEYHRDLLPDKTKSSLALC